MKKRRKRRKKSGKRIIILLLLCILALLCIGITAYVFLEDISMPWTEPVLSFIGLDGTADVSGREIKETDNGDDYYFATKKENIVQDTDTGILFVNNELLVTLNEEEKEDDLRQILADFDAEIVGKIGIVNQYQIQFQEIKTYEELGKIEDRLKEYKWIEDTCINWAMELDAESYYPNDKKWKNQWGDIPSGNNWGMEAIDAPGAWEYKDQMETINIGVIDTMFDVEHEDLLFVETPLGNDRSMEKQKPHEFEDNDSNHGTHVAGTFAATFDNQKGVAGVSVKNRLYGVSLWGIADYEYGTVMEWKIALCYLIVQKKCNVINISMGADWIAFEASQGTEEAQERLTEYSQELGAFLEKLLEDDYNFVICTAAGNQNDVGNNTKYLYFHKDPDDAIYSWQYYRYSDYLTYMEGDPDNELSEEWEEALSRYKGRIKKEDCEGGNVDAKYDIFAGIEIPSVKERIIVVGSVKNLGSHKEGGLFGIGGSKVHDGYELAADSQCGERVDVLAPGVNIYSTVGRGKGYEEGWKGTSMASPHAAGVAVLIYSVNPEISGERVKDIMLETAQGSYTKEGDGLVNAKLAVEKAMEESGTQETTITIEGTDGSEERDIVLVLDVSGSMTGEPIEETKKAATNFVQTILKEDASIGIVTYNSASSVESQFSTKENRLLEVVDQLASGGGTNIEDGLRQAEELLENSNAKKKIIVLMSDGEPTDGKMGDELIAYSDEMKQDGTYIYTLGFFGALSDKTQAQYLMEGIASEGCHYEVEDADNLVYFFGDIADQINGQKYIYIRIACPVDVSVTDGKETLCSKEETQSTRTNFGVMSFEESHEEENLSDNENDNRTKVLRLKEGTDYEVSIVGNGEGSMDYTIGLMDENGEYDDIRRFEGIQISKGTTVDTTAARAEDTILKVDQDGDGTYDLEYRAEENGYGEVVEHFLVIYVILIVGYSGCLLMGIVVYKKAKRGRRFFAKRKG